MDSNGRLEVKVPQSSCKLRQSKKQRVVWLTLFLVNLCTLTLQIAQLAVPEWIRVGTGKMKIVGGLLDCKDCPYNWSDTSYSEIIDDLCDSDGRNEDYCDFFERLKEPGGYFIFIECISGVFLLTWQVKLFFLLLRRECLSHIPWLAYVHPALSTVLQITSLSVWSAMTEAKYSGSCDHFEGKDSDVCVLAGPALAIVTCISLSLSTIAFSVALRLFEGPPRMPADPSDPIGLFALDDRRAPAEADSRA